MFPLPSRSPGSFPSPLLKDFLRGSYSLKPPRYGDLNDQRTCAISMIGRVCVTVRVRVCLCPCVRRANPFKKRTAKEKQKKKTHEKLVGDQPQLVFLKREEESPDAHSPLGEGAHLGVKKIGTLHRKQMKTPPRVTHWGHPPSKLKRISAGFPYSPALRSKKWSTERTHSIMGGGVAGHGRWQAQRQSGRFWAA